MECISENKDAEDIVIQGLETFGFKGIEDTRIMNRDRPLFSVNQVRVMMHQYLIKMKTKFSNEKENNKTEEVCV